jgi:tagatose 6-phosphate kinase
LAATVQRSLGDESAVIQAMREVRQRGARRVVVTAGKEPALALDEDRLWRIRSPRISPINPIGSGDAFTAGLVWRLLLGENLGDACHWAAAAGAANALSPMPGELARQEVERLAEEVKVDLI